MTKPKVTRTYAPIHFEDLDPHRFEDLIRELIYDYKEWQSIEATGRSGSDEGFDIRAYERMIIVSNSEKENSEDIEEVHPMEGNLWMIQGKREKEIGPKKVKTILSDINSKNPPYGYILAASVNFSKKSYDVFREELRKNGVMEFYLWGKAELEDMLHLPKNDRILFTFFGISYVSKRRSRTTEIRSSVNVKNKLFRILGEDYPLHQSILIRDLNDTQYPYENEYPDFDSNPRWKEYIVHYYHPLGLLCYSQEFFAYVDLQKKEWDYTAEINLAVLQKSNKDDQNSNHEQIELIKNFWDFLPRKNKCKLVIYCLIKYSDIALVDDKGDNSYDFPHIYTDFINKKGSFGIDIYILKMNNDEIKLPDDFKRISVFPDRFKEGSFGKIYKNKKIILNTESRKEFKEYRLDTIYEVDGKYDFLNSRDVIQIEYQETKTEDEMEEVLIQITHKFKVKAKAYMEQSQEPYKKRNDIEIQIGRTLKVNENINVYEFKKISKWELVKK